MPTTRTTCCRAESGFSLLEMIVVLVIIGILMGGGLYMVQSGRKAGRTVDARTITTAYTAAIERFARDHNGRYPGNPGTTDWPSTSGPGAPYGAGPTAKILGTTRGYLRVVPDEVQSKMVTINAPSDAELDYKQLSGGTGYEIQVKIKDREPCSILGGLATRGTYDACH